MAEGEGWGGVQREMVGMLMIVLVLLFVCGELDGINGEMEMRKTSGEGG